MSKTSLLGRRKPSPEGRNIMLSTLWRLYLHQQWRPRRHWRCSDGVQSELQSVILSHHNRKHQVIAYFGRIPLFLPLFSAFLRRRAEIKENVCFYHLSDHGCIWILTASHLIQPLWIPRENYNIKILTADTHTNTFFFLYFLRSFITASLHHQFSTGNPEK